MADGLGAMGGGQLLGRPDVLILDSLLLRRLSACLLRSYSRYGLLFRARCVSSIHSATCLSELILSVSDFRRSRLLSKVDVISLATGFASAEIEGREKGLHHNVKYKVKIQMV